MNSTAIGPSASKTSEENEPPVTVAILWLDPRLRGVVRGTSNVSVVIGPTYQNCWIDSSEALIPANRAGNCGCRVTFRVFGLVSFVSRFELNNGRLVLLSKNAHSGRAVRGGALRRDWKPRPFKT